MNSKTKIKIRPFDSAEFLDTSEAIAAYLADALNSGRSAEFQDALNVAIRAQGINTDHKGRSDDEDDKNSIETSCPR